VQQNIRDFRPQPQRLEQEKASSRSATTPAYHDESQLNRMLPPRRELPFTKTGKRKSRADSTSDRAPEQIVPQSSNERRANTPSRHNSYVPDSQPQSQPLPSTQPDPARGSPELQSYPIQGEKPLPPTARGRSPEIANTQLVQTQEYIPAYQTATVENQLEQYIISPTTERIAFLENWMCELIEDDKFLTLCQDVEGTWRRFAFGQTRGME
jgi:hypothetical protein